MKTKQSNLNWIYVIIFLVSIVLFWILISGTPQSKPTEIPVSQAIAMTQNNEIGSMTMKGPWLEMTATDGTTKYRTYVGPESFWTMTNMKLDGIKYDIQSGGLDWGSVLLTVILPTVLIGGLLFFFFYRARGMNNQAMSFGRSRARLFPGDKPTVTFNDVAGVDEAKQELREVVDFLKSRERFTTLGARIPRGVLLFGPPGTGKTLLAKAIAGEAGVPFFSISGSEFVEMFVGVGASRVRDLFDTAKRHAPCIIFIDEIDAVGRQRGAGLGGSHDEREQTLNQILTEMDGFDTNVNIIILAATNRPDILDPALLRPGRFDRRVVLDLPDINGRVAILKVHIKNKPVNTNISLERLARQTAGFSGADLANLVNEAAILAARRGKKTVDMDELEESIDKVSLGPERRSKRISPKEKEITAYHESGHAVVARLTKNADPPNKISIIPRGLAGGYMVPLTEDRSYYSRAMILDLIAVSLAGHASERFFLGEITSGSQSDLRHATDIARRMITDWGMSNKLVPRTFGEKQEMVFLGREISEQKDYSDKTAESIDSEINEIIKQQYEVATQILTESKDLLKILVDTLNTKETLDYEELEKLFKDNVPPERLPKKETFADLVKINPTPSETPPAREEK